MEIMDSYIYRTKKIVSLIIGTVIPTGLIQIVFILNAVQFNYYSGIDPASTIVYVPIYALIEVAVGLLILLILKLFGVALIRRPNEYLLLGFILGFGNLGSSLKFWFLPEYIEFIVYLIVVSTAFVSCIGESNSEPSS